MVIETWFRQDLKQPVMINRLQGTLFAGDVDANLIGVIVTDNGAAATLTGTVYGYIIRPDGETITVTGTISGNRASIVLSDDCYEIPGDVRISIKVGNATLCTCTGRVYITETDETV